METRRSDQPASHAKASISGWPDHREGARHPASDTESAQSKKPSPPWQETVTQEEKLAALLPCLGPIERQIVVRSWGRDGHTPQSVDQITQQLFGGAPIWRAKVQGTIQSVRSLLRSSEYPSQLLDDNRSQPPVPETELVEPESQDPDSSTGAEQPHKGKKLSPEHRAKISEAQKGKEPSPETRAKISKALKGRKLPPETRAKMSQSRSGKNHRLYDQSIDKVRLAIAAHARGESMAQASHDQGFSRIWLGNWKREHPERFRAFYRQAADNLDGARLEADTGDRVLDSLPGEAGFETSGRQR